MAGIEQLEIQAFRGLHELTASGLRRVNLFIGPNNSGKTSVLEAIGLLESGLNPGSVVATCRRRGEILHSGPRRQRSSVDPRHLFFGHGSAQAPHFKIQSGERYLRASLTEDMRQIDMLDDSDGELLSGLVLLLQTHESDWVEFPIGDLHRMAKLPLSEPATTNVQFVGTTEEHYEDLGALWESVLLTPKEADVIKALSIVEPRVQRVAYIGGRQGYGAFGNFVVLLDGDAAQRVPIGSMGDGMKRLLALSLHLAASARGVLLIDEIDTGLHHSVLTRTWELIGLSALRLQSQVFATTHSLDCIRSLAWFCERHPELADEVSVHRVVGDGQTVRYDGHELMRAVEHEIEMR